MCVCVHSCAHLEEALPVGLPCQEPTAWEEPQSRLLQPIVQGRPGWRPWRGAGTEGAGAVGYHNPQTTSQELWDQLRPHCWAPAS